MSEELSCQINKMQYKATLKKQHAAVQEWVQIKEILQKQALRKAVMMKMVSEMSRGRLLHKG